ncbi:YicC/YloC family endoribonuclease [Sediminibacillus massiliensis]|uniref:YicC/YloC family endoribonuclease n=1 Tax=Sediminibacillus massiliensis TaxID=1926277 RepID=UPI0009885376|nr:YicC/YloC family endoribonuclease [Sediminibacillus massiliensis]
MVRSMTGYGRAEISSGSIVVTAEIRSVNHRFLDVSTKLPRASLSMEDSIKRIAKKHFRRGRFDIFVNLEEEGDGSRTIEIDWNLMDQYIEKLREAKERYGLAGEIPVSMVTDLDQLFLVKEQEKVDEDLQSVVLQAVEKACSQVSEMREEEGKELIQDIKRRIEFLQNTAKWLGKQRDIVIMEYRERISNRIAEYVQEDFLADESRIIQEIALLAEKGDITEELTRLKSHIEQFLNTICLHDAIGRKLDFIVQEMLRETNTIGSKSNDVKVSEWVIAVKSELEKIKEQVQNIE